MNLLFTLASILGVEVDELIGGLKKNAIAWSAVALFALIGIAFLLVALHAGLVGWLGPIWAPLAIAGGALVVALAIFIVLRIADTIAERRSAERRHAAEKTALVTTAAISALPLLLKSDLMKKVGIPVGGALAAAYLLTLPGERTSHRKTASKQLSKQGD